MKRRNAWMKIKGDESTLTEVIQVIKQGGFAVSNLSLNRSLDLSSFHINMELEGKDSFDSLSNQIAALNDVQRIEFDTMG